jgi:hypothetical protein
MNSLQMQERMPRLQSGETFCYPSFACGAGASSFSPAGSYPERLPAAHVEDDRGQLTLERLEDFEMPLTRLNDKAFAASLAGVAFDMTDGSRTDIEAIASARFDAGRLENDGRIRVTTRDLNPHLFSPLHKTS